MAYPGQQWQQQHPQYNSNHQQNYGTQQWGPPPGAPPAGQGQVYANNDPNYPGQQYNQYGYIQGGNPPYGEPRPYPPDQFGTPQGPPPQHYGYDNQQQYQQNAPPQQYQQGPVHFKPQYGQQEPFYYKYSDCSGSRKALLVGINYAGSSNALRGCHNDVRNMSRFLKERYNYKEQDMVILMDDPSFGPRQQPTRSNIIDAMRWLVAGAQPNDSLFFHYSGHGGQTKDTNGDEEDGTDETIYPVDHQQAGMVVDDEMHEIMVRPLPAGCRLTAIFDSCHSGSALDLPYIYGTSGKIKEPNLLKDAGGATLLAVTKYAKGDLSGAVSSIFGMGKKLMGGNSAAAERTKMQNTSAADVIMWSGCKDDQTSADAQEAGQATGAMSYAFIASLTQFPQQSYMQLLNTVRDILKSKYSQKPQLSSSHPMDTNLLFVM